MSTLGIIRHCWRSVSAWVFWKMLVINHSILPTSYCMLGKGLKLLFLRHFWRQLTVGAIHTVKKTEALLHLQLRSSHKLTFGQPPFIYFPIITQWFLTVSVCRGFIPFFQTHILIFSTSTREFGRKCQNSTLLFTREKNTGFFLSWTVKSIPAST